MVGQELLILCEEDSASSSASSEPTSSSVSQRSRLVKRYSLFGRVNSRAECQPPPNANYMKLKALQVNLMFFSLFFLLTADFYGFALLIAANLALASDSSVWLNVNVGLVIALSCFCSVF